MKREPRGSSPLLADMVEEVLSLEVVLSNGLTIACFPCTLRSLRGWSIPAGVMDELAFFRLEGRPTVTPRSRPASGVACSPSPPPG